MASSSKGTKAVEEGPGNSKSLPFYKREEVFNHRTPESIWIIVETKVFDVTKFLQQHPGGQEALVMAGGQDVTWLMETSHPFTRSPWEILKRYEIGRTTPFVEYKPVDDSPIWKEMRTQVKAYFKRTGKDPKYALPGIAVFLGIMALHLVGFYYMTQGLVIGAVILGITRALFGVHTMHLCSHFALSHQPWVWSWGDWLCFDVLMGGSSLSWNYQHIMGHHQHTNVFEADPDLPMKVDGDIRRVHENQVPKWVYKFQGVYLPILYTLLVFKIRFGSDVMLMLGFDMNGNIPMNVSTRQRVTLWVSKIFWFIYAIYLPYQLGDMSVGTLFKLFVIADLFNGAWLAYFFQVNHISEDVAYTDMKTSTKKEWAAMQIEGTVDYSHDSYLWMGLSGTLNYQVVHHLFPSVSTHHYPAIAHIIKKVAKENGLVYQALPSFWRAAYNHVKELHRIGNPTGF